jgi:DNA invertase Pin-like site-specific DNA recombinase
MIYGYARVSRKQQNIERQIRNIKAVFPSAVIIQEIHTRTKFDGRKEWAKLMRIIKKGDTIVFDSVSRMSGNADEGSAVYEELYQMGVNLVFLKEEHINTDTYKKALQNNVELVGTAVDYILEGINKYLLALAKEQIRIAFEQSAKEVEDLHQRTREGLITARLNGKQIGRAEGTKVETKKSKTAKEQILKHSKDFDGNLNDIEMIQLLGVSRKSYYKYKRELKQCDM